jgi:hypothetical protein
MGKQELQAQFKIVNLLNLGACGGEMILGEVGCEGPWPY